MQRNLFSTEAAAYAHLRPTYPEALFRYLAGIAPARGCAWDCATGNGQAAIGLAAFFARVIATDESAEMIAQAIPCPRVEYRVAPAEASGLPAGSVDLLTVATAIHWLDLGRFYAEARRALRPGGVLAAWTYYVPSLAPEMDVVIRELAHGLLRPYWDHRLHYVEEEFHTLPFPFAEIAAPSFHCELHWHLNDLLAYLSTWSASVKYRGATGSDPTAWIAERLRPLWGDDRQPRQVSFPLYLRVGRA